MSPQVSLCVPLYNAPPSYLGDLLASLRAQTFDDYEVVIVDDCSAVDYAAVLAGFAGDQRVRSHRNAANLGMVGNWNSAVRQSRGDLVLVAGHDDMFEPEMLASFVNEFANPAVVLVSSAASYIGADGNNAPFRGNVNDRSRIFKARERYLLGGREATRLCLRNGAALGELAAQMFRRSAFEAVGGYDPSFPHAADLDFALRVAQQGETVYLNRRFLKRRMHDRNLTWKNLACGHVSRDRRRLHDRYCRSYDFSPRERAEFRAHLVACACYDVLRYPSHRGWNVVRYALGEIFRHLRPNPVVYWRQAREILTGVNLDER